MKNVLPLQVIFLLLLLLLCCLGRQQSVVALLVRRSLSVSPRSSRSRSSSSSISSNCCCSSSSECTYRSRARSIYLRTSLLFGSQSTLSPQQQQPKQQQDAALHRRRKLHVNKYANLTISKVDPFESAIQQIEELKKQQSDAQQHQDDLRGTTVPTMIGSNNIKNKKPSNYTTASRNCSNEYAKKTINPLTIIPSDPQTFGFVEVGTIIAPHGINGELKIEFGSDFGELRVQPNSILYIKNPNRKSPRPVRVLGGKRQVGETFIVQFEGIQTRTYASALKHYSVYVKETDRPPLLENEHLVGDLVGLQCVDNSHRDGIPIGTVIDVLSPLDLFEGPLAKLIHPMLEIRKYRSKQLFLIPYVKDLVRHIDLVLGKIYVELPDGLLDLSYATPDKSVIRGCLPESISWLDKARRSILTDQTILLHPKGGVVVVDD